jgi:hypothetical protein
MSWFTSDNFLAVGGLEETVKTARKDTDVSLSMKCSTLTKIAEIHGVTEGSFDKLQVY